MPLCTAAWLLGLAITSTAVAAQPRVTVGNASLLTRGASLQGAVVRSHRMRVTIGLASRDPARPEGVLAGGHHPRERGVRTVPDRRAVRAALRRPQRGAGPRAARAARRRAHRRQDLRQPPVDRRRREGRHDRARVRDPPGAGANRRRPADRRQHDRADPAGLVGPRRRGGARAQRARRPLAGRPDRPPGAASRSPSQGRRSCPRGHRRTAAVRGGHRGGRAAAERPEHRSVLRLHREPDGRRVCRPGALRGGRLRPGPDGRRLRAGVAQPRRHRHLPVLLRDERRGYHPQRRHPRPGRHRQRRRRRGVARRRADHRRRPAGVSDRLRRLAVGHQRRG